MDRVRLGLIGLGQWPRQAYLPVLAGLDSVEVCAVAARSSASQEYAREQLGPQVVVYSDYRELLEDPAVEAVTLAVPNPIHAEALGAAVSAGKHLFYEPPLAHDHRAIMRLLRKMAASDRVIQPDLELRCLPVVEAAGERLQAGAIGQVLMASVRLWSAWGHGGGQWKYHPEEEGFFPWLGCWYLDLLDCVFTAAPQRATVTGGYAANGRLMDHGWCSLEYPAGRIGRFEFNLVGVGGLEVGLSVLGSDGEIEADLVRGLLRWRSADASWQEAACPASQPTCGFVGMRECLGRFIESVRLGRPLGPDIEVARRVHAAMLGCAQAEAAGVTVSVDPLR
jgi:predicted dehydrogenase